MRRPAAPLVFVLASVLLAAPAAAQFPFADVRPRFDDDDEPVRWRRLAGASPIHALLGSAAGDYEQAVRRDVSLGGGVTFSGPNTLLRGSTSAGYDLDVTAKARYYVGGHAPAGPSFGVVAGVLHGRRGRVDGADPGLPEYRAVTVPTLGITADYNQFVGPTRRLVFGTGYGVKRRYASRGTGDYRGISQFRFLVGYAW